MKALCVMAALGLGLMGAMAPAMAQRGGSDYGYGERDYGGRERGYGDRERGGGSRDREYGFDEREYLRCNPDVRPP